MEPLVAKWLRGTAPPATIYELLGRPLLDPDAEALDAALRALNRAAWPYQTHPDAETARRALDLLAELGRAAVVLGDSDRRISHEREALDRLAAEYAARRPDPDGWRTPLILAWLDTEKDVHRDRLGEALAALLDSPLKPADAPALVEDEATRPPRPGRRWMAGPRPRALAGVGLAALALAVLLTPPLALRLRPTRQGGRPPDQARPIPPEVIPPATVAVASAPTPTVVVPPPEPVAKKAEAPRPAAPDGMDPEALLASAEAALRDDRASEGGRALAQYLDQPGALERERARRLLDQVELTSSRAGARDLLRSLGEAELAEFARSGTMGLLDRVEIPALRRRMRDALARELLSVLRERAGLSIEDGSRLPAAGPLAAQAAEAPAPTVRLFDVLAGKLLMPAGGVGLSPRDGSRLPTAGPLAAEPAPRGDAAAAGPEVEASLDRVLAAPGDYEGKSIVPPGYFHVATRPVPLGEGLYTLAVKTREGWAVASPSRDDPGGPRLLLDAKVAATLSLWLGQHRVHPDGVAESRCILKLAVRERPGGAGRDVVIIGLEYLFRVDNRRLLNGSGLAFETLQVGPESATLTFADRRGWLGRLGGETYVEALRRHLRNTHRR